MARVVEMRVLTQVLFKIIFKALKEGDHFQNLSIDVII
jgi:hypothetical protein